MGAWRGIRYARADRWQAPQVVAWDGSDPGAHGTSAPQGPIVGVEGVPGMDVEGPTGEDCHYLNIWTPEPAEGLPVMVWIHGGKYEIGSGSLPTYDGTRLADEGVVVVGINFRLGALASPNLAVLDQVAALQWVHDNIAQVGGDPGTVTIFGESAGAGAIHHLLGVPAADGLYHRAILQRPGAEVVQREQHEALREALFARVAPDAPVEAILAAQNDAAQDVAHLFGAMPWAPVVDGDVLPGDPRDRVAAGIDVDLLVGTTGCELEPYTAVMKDLPPEAIGGVLQHLVRPIVGRDPGDMTKLVEAYDRDYGAVLSDAAMAVPVVRLLDAHRGRAFSYVFGWESPVVGSAHATDLPFTFGTFDVDTWKAFVGWDADAEALSARMRKAWANFARTGDPGWPAWGPDRQTMVFDRTDEVRTHPSAANLHLHPERELA
jgi:para-nitrobenzyl esterase